MNSTGTAADRTHHPIECPTSPRPPAVIEFTLDGTIIAANETFLGITGYTLAEIVGQHHAIFLHPGEDKNPDYTQFWADLRRGEVKTALCRRLGKGGREVWLQAAYSPIRTENGQVTRILKIATEVTNSKLENANSLDQIRALQRSQAVIEFAMDGTILTANGIFLKSIGYTLDEITGQHHSILVDPSESASPAYQAFWKDLRAGVHRTAEFARLRKDGGQIWLHATYIPILDLNDQPYKIVKFANDITPQVIARRTLSAVLNTALDGLITIDGAGTIETFNPAAAKLFGYEEQEAIGQNVSMLMPEPYQSGHDGFLRSYMETGTAKVIGIGRELQARHKTGRVFPIELGVNDMHVGGKRMFVGTVKDITERKQAEASLAESFAAVLRSNQELDDFAYVASHDLKEPLRGLTHNALFLKEDFGNVLGEGGLRRLDRMSYLCERMDRLINDLLYFSRLGRQALAIRQTDLNMVIADIKSMMEFTLTEQNAKLIVPESLPVIVCDQARITEVFRNLITNAVKYNDKPEKRVEIGCTGTDEARIYHVRDNGIGIAEKFHDDIFRIFKRLNTEDDKVKGTGVGLTFVKKIIERHGGNIWVESTPGIGTTMRFSLPAMKEA
jgi:PAS domain S-box-containing protein